MRAEVVVAEELTDVEVTRIRLTLQAATGKEILVEQLLDPEIIGGVTGSTVGCLTAVYVNNYRRSNRR